MALYQIGDFDKGKAYMDAVTGAVNRIDTSRSFWALVAACFCYISGETDLLADVEAAARDAMGNPELPPFIACDAHAALAQVAVLRHEASTAAEQYAALKPYANTVTHTGAICIDRLLGLLAYTMGNLDTAQTHFEAALTFCRRAGYRPELAWTCHDYAEMLLARNAAGDRQKASALIEEGLAIATELGMKPLVGRLEALQQKLAALRRGRPEYPDGLSEREVEVLRLIAAGKTNQEIAEALVISLNTVARHVSNIFDKTGAANRAEAATYAARQGLLP
jgi:DNA-binding CsgD family transcriptional regulator